MENWYSYLKDREFEHYDYLDTRIPYKIIRKDQLDALNVDVSTYPQIGRKDPLIKLNKKLDVGDVVAIYRDYEVKVSPYYFLRVVVNKL